VVGSGCTVPDPSDCDTRDDVRVISEYKSGCNSRITYETNGVYVYGGVCCVGNWIANAAAGAWTSSCDTGWVFNCGCVPDCFEKICGVDNNGCTSDICPIGSGCTIPVNPDCATRDDVWCDSCYKTGCNSRIVYVSNGSWYYGGACCDGEWMLNGVGGAWISSCDTDWELGCGCVPSCIGITCGSYDNCGFHICGEDDGCVWPCSSCEGLPCGSTNSCEETCTPLNGCCEPSCTGITCGSWNSCNTAICYAGSSTCTTASCTPVCTGKYCGTSDGCGGICYRGFGYDSGCISLWDANGDGTVDADDGTAAGVEGNDFGDKNNPGLGDFGNVV
jgi:hypothetical protein